jgi:hypothetical protein
MYTDVVISLGTQSTTKTTTTPQQFISYIKKISRIDVYIWVIRKRQTEENNK